MVKEAYCSYEVAKLLKEKGFESKECHFFYDEHGNTYVYGGYSKDKSICIDKPTQQMAMAWLREEHKLFIEIRAGKMAMAWLREEHKLFNEIRADINDDKIWYDFDVIPLDDRYINPDEEIYESGTYEEAVEAAIQYCLTNLI